MSKKGFFALNDDIFWGNGVDKSEEVPSAGEETPHVKEEERDLDLSPVGSPEHKAGEWIDVPERSNPRPAMRKQQCDSRAMEAQANLLSRKDFTALEVFNTVCRDRRRGLGPSFGPADPSASPFPSGGHVNPFSAPVMQSATSAAQLRPTGPFMPQPQSADASGFGAGLGRFKRPNGGSSSRCEEDDTKRSDTSSSDCSLDARSTETFAGARNNNRVDQSVPMIEGPNRPERPSVNLLDEKYVEYYEHLCKGIGRLLESAVPIHIDCESRSGPQTGTGGHAVCRALKAKYYHQYSPGPEVYSRKVFVGGLPIDIDEDELIATFSTYGPLSVDWPNKNENKSYYPPKGYVFLIFDYEMSVRALVQQCFVEDEKLFLYISSPLSPEKLVQIRPWKLADADYLVDVNVPINPRRVVFVGGVPRPIRAVELAHIMDRLYGSVSCAGIDTDVEYKYPKGAGRVAFTNYSSYMRAITDRYAQLSHGEVEKRVEMKPYVLDDQMCEECAGRHAPFFCPHLECLQYYCESCWTAMHGCPSREDHKPLVKEA